MWLIVESRSTRRSLRKLPVEIIKRYEKWKIQVQFAGPSSLRLIRGFRDEALEGEWFGYRSSRLNIQYRVIYRVVKNRLQVEVVELNAHKY